MYRHGIHAIPQGALEWFKSEFGSGAPVGGFAASGLTRPCLLGCCLSGGCLASGACHPFALLGGAEEHNDLGLNEVEKASYLLQSRRPSRASLGSW